jgi:hypothetical protein
MNINLFNSVKYGLIMGTGFCLYTVLMWLTNLDSTYLNVGQYFDIAIILLPITVISMGIYQQNKLKSVTLMQRIFVAITISSISFVIYDPFLYFYHNIINPEWFSSVLALKGSELSNANVSADSITEQLQQMKDSSVANAGVFQLSSAIPSVIVIPVLISFLSLLFIKNTKKDFNL